MVLAPADEWPVYNTQGKLRTIPEKLRPPCDNIDCKRLSNLIRHTPLEKKKR